MLTLRMQEQRKHKKCKLDYDENSDVEMKRSMMSIDDDDIADVGVCMLW